MIARVKVEKHCTEIILLVVKDRETASHSGCNQLME